MRQSNTIAAAITSVVIATGIPISHAFASPTSHGHASSPSPSAASEQHDFGQPGDIKKVSRTIAIEMADAMRFTPAAVTVKQGETIRFIVKNKGKLLHEMVLGTMDTFKAHGNTMAQHPNAAHDEPSAIRVEPGQKGDIVWQFTKGGEFHFACLVPGHFEAGMVGKIKVMKG